MAGKTVRPPPLPEETFARVLRLASFDGRVLVALAGTFAIFSAIDHQAAPTVAAVLAVGMGLTELHGTNRLRAGFIDGINWIVGSQVGLMLTLFLYAGWRIAEFDVQAFINTLPPDVLATMEAQLRSQGVSVDELPKHLLVLNILLFGLLAVVAFFYQGGMALYYRRKRAAIATVLAPQR